MFDLAWIERELAGLIIQLHQTEGAIAVLQQMKAQLEGAAQSAPQDALTLSDLEALLPAGDRVEEGIQRHAG